MRNFLYFKDFISIKAFILKTVLASTDEIMLFSYYPYYEIASSFNKKIFLSKSIEEKRIFKVIERLIKNHTVLLKL